MLLVIHSSVVSPRSSLENPNLGDLALDTSWEAFDFLGYRFENGRRMPSPKSLKKIKDTLRGKTKRTNG